MADKNKKTEDKKSKSVETTAFVMTNAADGKKIKVHAPNDSLDKDGNAEEALTGTYRFA